jgi:hypothetical protein
MPIPSPANIEICKLMARLERESYEAWLARTIREAADRAAKYTEKRNAETKIEG